MAVKIRFTKAPAKPKPKKPKQSGGKKATLNKLNSFLKQEEPKTVEILVNNLHAQGNSVTYKELREAYLAGGLTEKQFTTWQKKYSKLVEDALKPEWEKAVALAAQEAKDKYPYFLYEPGVGAAADWIKQHGAELVTNLAADQVQALNAIIGHVSGYTAITPDEAAQIMRPCIGLTKPQALANARYRESVKEAYLKAHPKGKPETAEKKAQEAAARYAARQHRYRAQSIARTELAYGYNAGAYGATKDAQAQGYIGDCAKVWVTAYDERVCPICSQMDEEKRGMDEMFSNGKLLPPGHPQCRCAVAYEEIEGTNIQPQAANGTAGAQAQSQSTTAPAGQAAGNAPAQAAQPEPPDPNAPAIPPDIEIPDGMTYNGKINLGGTGEMYSYTDAEGHEWLFKPAQSKSGHPEMFRAYSQEAGYKVQAIVDPDTAVPVGTGTLDGRFGAFQRRLDTLDSGGLKYWQKGNVMGWEDFDLMDTDIFEQMQREHATDWLLGNFDSHGGNFVTDMSGRMIGIDKEQAFKYLSDPKSRAMSYTYHPNAKYGETEPIYNTLFRKYANGDIDLDLNESLKYIKRVEAIPDEEYREIFREYAESLHGKGAKAEELLDAIVERKSGLRETYRDFYSALETERTGTKTVFQFSDEIAGTVTPKPVPKPKAPAKPKTPKTTPTPATPKTVPVKTEGGYRVSEVLDDLTVLPQNQNGVAIHSDGGMLEQMNLTGRRVTISGSDYYELSGKLTEETWEAAARNAQKRGMQRPIEFLTRNADGTYSFSNVGTQIDGYKIMDINQSQFEIYSDYMGKTQYSMGGFFRIRVPATGNAAADRKAMEEIIDKAGLRSLTVDPTDAEELLLKKSRIAWQRDPKGMASVERATAAQRTAKIDQILRKEGITDARVQGMTLQEVFPGYSTYVDDAARMEYRKAGLTHIWAGVDNADSVVAICKSDGFTATNYRITSGMKKCGASPGADMQSGGADSVFTRIGVKTKDRYSSSYLGSSYRVIIDPDELNRTDWYAYGFDNYGNARMDGSRGGFDGRKSSVDFVKSMSARNGYSSSNEIMFRHGISTDKFLGISCESESERTLLIQKFRDAGITEYNGIDIDDFIQVTKSVQEDCARGIQGLSYYDKDNPF